MLSNIVTSNNLQNLSYEYDKFGNLASRKDNLRNQEETFHYDKMNRLTDIYLGTTHSQIVYDPLGHKTNMLWENITHISGIANPHAHHQRIANPLERGTKPTMVQPQPPKCGNFQ
jgi:YD repeat-containing protein